MFTVILSYVEPEFRTIWHPTESKGPFARITRGAFKSQLEALQWVDKNVANGLGRYEGVEICEMPEYKVPE